VDARLYHLQSQAKFVTPPELLALLQEFYRETLALVQGRQVNARSITDYNANNAYQQVLGRQDVHLRWLSDAIDGLGGAGSSPGQAQEDAVTSAPKDVAGLVAADERNQHAFLERWTERVASVTHARHRKMLELILGEMQEHLRVLQQAQAGRGDMLGHQAKGKIERGEVMAARPKN
jgi:hypothetical protein